MTVRYAVNLLFCNVFEKISENCVTRYFFSKVPLFTIVLFRNLFTLLQTSEKLLVFILSLTFTYKVSFRFLHLIFSSTYPV